MINESNRVYETKIFCKENYKVVKIIRFILYQSIVFKYSQSIFYKDWILIKVVKTDTYYISSFMKGSNCSHKLRYERYLKLIYKCLLDYMYTKLTHMRILYGEITSIYRKPHMIIM